MKKSVFLSESDFEFGGKAVLLRIDCDVDLRKEGDRWVVDEDFRLRSALPTIHLLKKRKVRQIILLGHLDRPGGRVVKNLSLQPVADWFEKNVGSCQLLSLEDKPKGEGFLYLFENLRFSPKEAKNDEEFAKRLANFGDVYINDAFGVSHRKHASIVKIPKLLPSFLGLRVEGEIKMLSWLKDSSPRPLVFVLGGSKPGKLGYLDFLARWSDWLLVGGRLPFLIQKSKLKLKSLKVVIGRLNKEGKDIDDDSIRRFRKIIGKAKCLVWAGPMGVYEEEKSRRGTWEVVKSILESNALKIAGGGDTHRILSWMGAWDGFDFVSVGGGAMLEFLKEKTLPGIEVIKEG